MSTHAPTRCAQPTVGARKTSTYTVLGFTGYAVATVVALVLSRLWSLSLVDRFAALVAPPIAFLVVVSSIRRRLGYERIVFFQTASAAVLAATAVSLLVGGDAARVFDVTCVGVGVFLAFGRLGCFSVACCHGRLAKYGVVYGPAHVAAGFWARWVGRPLWPVQLVEAGASLVFVGAALAIGWDVPGQVGLVYALSYAVLRFGLELLRGDATRPMAWGVSEAQWTSLAIAISCLGWRPSLATGGVVALLAISTLVLAATRARRALVQPAHVRDLDRAAAASLADGQRHETTLGVAVSYAMLLDGRSDWILSSMHPRWSARVAGQLASQLWPEIEIVEGRLAALVHVIVPRNATLSAQRRELS